MSATGVGASVRRKEDFRFITGKGNYPGDINRSGQAHAYFLRSPHAHANIRSIDIQAARKMPGVVEVLTGEDLAADKVGGLICGWMIHSKDGSPMKAGAHPALAQGKVRYVGDHVAVVIAESLAQAKDAAEVIDVDYAVLSAPVDTATGEAAKPARPRSGTRFPTISASSSSSETKPRATPLSRARAMSRARPSASPASPRIRWRAAPQSAATTGERSATRFMRACSRRTPCVRR